MIGRALASLVLLSALAASTPAQAQSDTDGDLVPNFVDNCQSVANGPNQTTNQVDSDMDGYGNRCDADYNNDFATSVVDFGRFLQCLGAGPAGPGGPSGCPETDHDGNQAVSTGDFGIFLGKFSGTGAANGPGPSGLTCAGRAPCRVYFRRAFGAVDTPGLSNVIVSPTDYQVLAFQIPPGYPGDLILFRMLAGAPGGFCAGGAQCYADGRYALAGWSDLAAAEASPTAGTLFHFDLDASAIQIQPAGTSNGGVSGNPSFPLSLLSVSLPIMVGATCPATGCVVALLADVSEAPGLVFEARTTTFAPPGTPVDHALCPVGCEGGAPVAHADIELIVAPTP